MRRDDFSNVIRKLPTFEAIFKIVKVLAAHQQEHLGKLVRHDPHASCFRLDSSGMPISIPVECLTFVEYREIKR